MCSIPLICTSVYVFAYGRRNNSSAPPNVGKVAGDSGTVFSTCLRNQPLDFSALSAPLAIPKTRAVTVVRSIESDQDEALLTHAKIIAGIRYVGGRGALTITLRDFTCPRLRPNGVARQDRRRVL